MPNPPTFARIVINIVKYRMLIPFLAKYRLSVTYPNAVFEMFVILLNISKTQNNTFIHPYVESSSSNHKKNILFYIAS